MATLQKSFLIYPGELGNCDTDGKSATVLPWTDCVKRTTDEMYRPNIIPKICTLPLGNLQRMCGNETKSKRMTEPGKVLNAKRLFICNDSFQSETDKRSGGIHDAHSSATPRCEALFIFMLDAVPPLRECTHQEWSHGACCIKLYLPWRMQLMTV